MLYAGGDYALYPNIMLLVQVMAYVMSGTFAQIRSGGYRRSLCPVEFPRCHLRTPLVSRASHDVDVPFCWM